MRLSLNGAGRLNAHRRLEGQSPAASPLREGLGVPGAVKGLSVPPEIWRALARLQPDLSPLCSWLLKESELVSPTIFRFTGSVWWWGGARDQEEFVGFCSL